MVMKGRKKVVASRINCHINGASVTQWHTRTFFASFLPKKPSIEDSSHMKRFLMSDLQCWPQTASAVGLQMYEAGRKKSVYYAFPSCLPSSSFLVISTLDASIFTLSRCSSEKRSEKFLPISASYQQKTIGTHLVSQSRLARRNEFITISAEFLREYPLSTCISWAEHWRWNHYVDVVLKYGTSGFV